MLHLFLKIWFSLPMGWRYIIMIIPLAIGLIATIALWDWVPIAIAVVPSLILFLLPGQSEAEKKGYNF